MKYYMLFKKYHLNLIKQVLSIYQREGFISMLFFLSKGFNYAFIYPRFKNSFSQKGEDLIIDKLLGYKKKGSYIDVGAHNPDKLSNTKRFYLRGWRGINIEPNPKLLSKFISKRNKDINLNLGISEKRGFQKFYLIDPDGLSTFSPKEAKNHETSGYKTTNVLVIKTLPLRDIFKKYVRRNVDFLSIDTEGCDLEVLKSNDWRRFKPKIICIETGVHDNWKNLKKTKLKSIESFLKTNGYLKYFDNGLNSIFIDKIKFTESQQ